MVATKAKPEKVNAEANGHSADPLPASDYRRCGCAIYLGLRIDTHEPALIASPCRLHKIAMTAVIEEYRRACDDPAPDPRYEGRAVIDIMDGMLREAGVA